MFNNENLHGDVQTDCVKQQGLGSLREKDQKNFADNFGNFPAGFTSVNASQATEKPEFVNAEQMAQQVINSSAQQVEVMNFASNEALVQNYINTYTGKGSKLALSVYNREYDAKSFIYADFMGYHNMRLSINGLQYEKLLNYCLTDKKEQIFPLSEEDRENATEEQLAPVANIREKLLTDCINKAYRHVKVLLFKSNETHYQVHANLKGALITFWVAKDSEVVNLMRQKHLVL